MKNNRNGQAATLSNDEYSKIRRQIVSEKYKILFALGWYTGERWGALIQLKVSDVYDPSGKPYSEITFRATTRKKDPDGSSATRQVPIHDLLREQLAYYKPDKDSIWLFPGRDFQNHTCWRNVYDILTSAVEKAGLASKGVSTHSTRRSFVTNLHNNGVSLATIKRITGHKDIKSLERYIDIGADQLKGAIATL
ncbi:xerD, integrase/recombinase XerD [Nostoc flagelliforme CCNUN1]|uniref:XerD, integrase/recombinase XerD n=1 Tax=Nostoc flagelliforme CCNUN1 TaxID=2038116 RepID=A0A2K8SMD6_9NOSO|nr:tyrosine-type recombinase/integrase [Nostoc flagelliforme]AUB36634.1 xerD, integrase/recombinase XerD [Nostoc flagelliforme CCNUN1]